MVYEQRRILNQFLVLSSELDKPAMNFTLLLSYCTRNGSYENTGACPTSESADSEREGERENECPGISSAPDKAAEISTLKGVPVRPYRPTAKDTAPKGLHP